MVYKLIRLVKIVERYLNSVNRIAFNFDFTYFILIYYVSVIIQTYLDKVFEQLYLINLFVNIKRV